MLHSIGLWCGVAIFVALRMLGARAYRLSAQAGLVLLMMVLTFVSNKLIILPMEHDRQAAGGDVNLLLKGSPLRDDFEARHAWSTRVEGIVILAGTRARGADRHGSRFARADYHRTLAQGIRFKR